MLDSIKNIDEEGNYVDGANIAGLKRVADAMMAETVNSYIVFL